MDRNPYTVRRVFSFDGDGGPGFSACLLENGRMVAVVMDGGSDGFLQYRWVDQTAFARLHEFVVRSLESGPQAAAFGEGVPEQILARMQVDTFVAQRVDAAITHHKLRRLCRRKTLFRIAGDASGEYRFLHCPWTMTARQYLEEKYGSALVEVLNEAYFPLSP